VLPIARPGKIVAVGLNYRAHAEEQEAKLPERPILFANVADASAVHAVRGVSPLPSTRGASDSESTSIRFERHPAGASGRGRARL